MWLRVTLATAGGRAQRRGRTHSPSRSVRTRSGSVPGDASRKFDASIPWVRFTVVAPLRHLPRRLRRRPRPPERRLFPDGRPAVGHAVGDAERHRCWADRSHVHERRSWSTRSAVRAGRSILKGAYPHTTRVYQERATVSGPGVVQRLLDGRHMAGRRRVRDRVRRQVLQRLHQARAAYVPPGWDRGRPSPASDVGGGTLLRLRAERRRHARNYGSPPADYSTDVLAGYATSFIRSGRPTTPVPARSAPYGPHEPATRRPATRTPSPAPSGHRTTTRPTSPTSRRTSERSRPSDHAASAALDTHPPRQLRTLAAVDEAVADRDDALRRPGRHVEHDDRVHVGQRLPLG